MDMISESDIRYLSPIRYAKFFKNDGSLPCSGCIMIACIQKQDANGENATVAGLPSHFQDHM